MTITITAFANSPDRGRGQARDMRVRWALEELSLPYRVRLLTFEEMTQPDHLSLQPFGQIPTFEEEGLTLFESGAIVLHLAQRHAGLLSTEPTNRAKSIAWLFAALNTLEPPILERECARFLACDKHWYAEHIAMVETRICERLNQLSTSLGDASWLAGEFSVGDLMIITVLRRLEDSGLLDAYPRLVDYMTRGKARPAYQRAFDVQLSVFSSAVST